MKHEIERALVRYESTPEGCRAMFVFPGDLDVFRGHFPGRPIVPAVYLVEAVRVAVEATLGRPLGIRGVQDAKFVNVVRPGDEVEVEVAITDLSCRANLTGGTRIRLDLADQSDAGRPAGAP